VLPKYHAEHSVQSANGDQADGRPPYCCAGTARVGVPRGRRARLVLQLLLRAARGGRDVAGSHRAASASDRWSSPGHSSVAQQPL